MQRLRIRDVQDVHHVPGNRKSIVTLHGHGTCSIPIHDLPHAGDIPAFLPPSGGGNQKAK